MPHVGERKTVGGTTGEWDGQTWRHVSGALPALPSGALTGPQATQTYDSSDPVAQAKATLAKFSDPSSLSAGYERTNADTQNEQRRIARTVGRPQSMGEWGSQFAGGVAHSPKDALMGLLGLPQQAWKGLTEDIPTLVRDPSLLKEAPTALADTATTLGDSPDALGSLLGQAAIGKYAAPYVPRALRAAAEKGPGIVGRGLGAVGRGVEAVGRATGKGEAGNPLVRGMAGHMVGGPFGAAAATVVPPALEMTGRGLQTAGKAIASTDVMGRLQPVIDAGSTDVLEGLRNAASRFRPGPKPMAGPPKAWTPQSHEVPGGTISDKMVEFMGPTEEGAKPPEPGGFGTESTVPTREDLARQLLESPSFKGLQRAANKPATPARTAASSFSNEFGITDPEVARYADTGQDPLMLDYTEPDTARTLAEVSHPGAQRYIQSQHDLINGPGYESTRQLLDQLNNGPRATNYIRPR